MSERLSDDGLRELCTDITDTYQGKRIGQLARELLTYREAWRKYGGRHTDDCEEQRCMSWKERDRVKCYCGLDQLPEFLK